MRKIILLMSLILVSASVSACSSEVIMETDISEYTTVFGETAVEPFDNKWGVDDDIFPNTIGQEEAVEDFLMLYDNPFDAQFLGKMVVAYDQADYANEIARLQEIGIDDYEGIYSATGFREGYELVAMNSDEEYGLVYALADDDNRIVYVEMIFCNYFMDVSYAEYIEEEYLPIGFDASKGNEYREMML